MDSMTKDLVDAIAKLAIPIALIWIGFLITTRIEKQKSELARSSEFKVKWADNFYDKCQEFTFATDRYMSILFFITEQEKECDRITALKSELTDERYKLNMSISELILAIDRMSLFAIKTGADVKKSAEKIPTYFEKMMTTGTGTYDELIALQHIFNKNVKAAHAEMLEIGPM
ncbi:hypothetical protein H8L32_18120 [Undibacterium sp. CY18W]|uniref:Uncharacterized protein n=1 Tax=Undibacterium hunanense TaxID=2762292 RepID=A0ABR6ZU84_9BURK|nr:hypothetical protein [Undibacterium hunanense]MBC3919413.1 hypothetical protein [Undibacterium hunanense]